MSERPELDQATLDEAPPPPTDADAPADETAPRRARRNGQEARRVFIPPHNIEAEEAVLGAMMSTPADAQACFAVVSVDELYREDHQLIARTIARLLSEGAPDTGPVAVWGALGTAEREALGGAGILHAIWASTVAAAAGPWHARRVAELARQRALYDAATNVAQAIAEGRPADEVLGALRIELETLPAAPDAPSERLGAISARELCAIEPPADEQLLGPMLVRGQRLVIGAHTGQGKALALATPIPTPHGWTTMGALRVGDQVFDDGGQPCRVTAVTGVMHKRRCYEVVFSDGSRILADAEHRWLTFTNQERIRWRTDRSVAGSVRTTQEIAQTLRRSGGGTNHAVLVAGVLAYPPTSLPIDPYLLGIWLGDGTSAQGRITTPDPEVIGAFELAGYSIGLVTPAGRAATYGIQGLQAQLRALGVLGNKHIPRIYLEASPAQRLALLQGLMDSDGTTDANGSAFDTTREVLAEGVRELIVGLGWKTTIQKRRARLRGIDKGPAFRLQFTPTGYVFRLPRQRARQKRAVRSTHRWRYILAVNSVPSVPVRCIAVDSPSHLFLAGESCIPTHNTTLSLQAAAAVCDGREFLGFTGSGGRALVIDAEQGLRSLQRRLREAGLESSEGIDIVRVPDGLTLDTDERQRRALEDLVAQGGYDVVVADPLYKLHSGDPNDSREAVALMRYFDRLRDAYGFCFILPVHCRKPPPIGGRFSIHEFFGSSAYGWGAEVVVGVQMLRAGYSRLHWFKDRDGDLPVGAAWGLLFDRETGFRRDPADLEKRATAAERVVEILSGTPGRTAEEIAEEIKLSVRWVKDALKASRCVAKTSAHGLKLWYPPADEETAEQAEEQDDEAMF